MALLNLKPSTKGITVLIIIAVVIFLACGLAYFGASSTVNALDDKLAANQKKAQSSQQIAKTLEDAKYELADTQSQLQCLESSVSTQAFVPTLLQQLEHLGRSVNLKVVGVRPLPIQSAPVQRKLTSGAQASEGNVQAASTTTTSSTAQPASQAGTAQPGAAGTTGAQTAQARTPQKPYDELKVTVELEGSYMNALDFLYRLTSFQKIIAVDNVEISPTTQSAGKSSPELTIKMSITAFIFKNSDPTKQAPATTGTAAAEGRTANAAG